MTPLILYKPRSICVKSFFFFFPYSNTRNIPTIHCLPKVFISLPFSLTNNGLTAMNDLSPHPMGASLGDR